jgi:hypothetical protein
MSRIRKTEYRVQFQISYSTEYRRQISEEHSISSDLLFFFLFLNFIISPKLPEIFLGRSRFVVRFNFFFNVFLTATSFGAATVGGVARPLDFCGSG